MRTSLILLSSLALAAAASAQVDFSFDFDANTSSQWKSTFQHAAAIWGATLTGSTSAPVDLRFKVGTGPQGVNAGGRPYLGGNSSYQDTVDYSSFRGALAANPSKSAADAAALAHLESGSTYSLQVNDVKVQKDADGNTVFDDSGRGVPDLDANGNYQYLPGHTYTSSQMELSTANMKALGLAPTYDGDFDPNGTGKDGYDGIIEFADFSDVSGSHLDWDFDPSDGIGTNGGLAYDALGTALHEIGHALGYISDVDLRDYYIGHPDDDYQGTTGPLDLFRYEKVNGQWVRSMQIGPRDERFSVDGQAIGERFSMGQMEGGKGWQASHWYEDSTDSYAPTGYGLMKPASYKNMPNVFGGSDLAAFDAMGWNLTPQAVPEPASLAALGLGALAVLRRRRI